MSCIASCKHTVTYPFLAGAPAVASSSGQFAPGNACAKLGDLKQSHTTRMLQQSSKYGQEEAEPTEVASTPRRPPESKEVESIEVADSPPSRSKLPTPRSASKSARPDVRRQLFGSSRRATPKKAAPAPKPEAYWKLLVQLVQLQLLNFVQTIYQANASTKGSPALSAQCQGGDEMLPKGP